MCLVKMLLLRLWLLKGKKKKEVFKHKTFPATKVFHQIKLGGGDLVDANIYLDEEKK
jgi:hypothetical protein